MILKLRFYVVFMLSVLCFTSCKTTDTVSSTGGVELPLGAEIGLPSGVELVSLEITGPDDIVVPDEGLTIEVRYELNRTLPEDAGIRIIPVALRDVEAIRGAPLCIGWFGINGRRSSGTGVPVKIVCEDGKIAGRTRSTVGDADLTAYDRSSGERRTRVYLQHAEDIRTFVGMEVGLRGLKSNRIRVRCSE